MDLKLRSPKSGLLSALFLCGLMMALTAMVGEGQPR